MNGNVKIPLALLNQIIYLLDHINIHDYSDAIQYDYDNVLFALNKKKASLVLRHAYANIINAKGDDARHDARMHYLLQRRAFDGDW